jgi:hypothetical protein
MTQQYQITYMDSAVATFDITYPKTVRRGEEITLEIRVRHVGTSPPTSDATMIFDGEPSTHLRVFEQSNTLSLGALANGTMLFRTFRFRVSDDVPYGQALIVKMQTWSLDPQSTRFRLVPDIVMNVESGPIIVTTTTATTTSDQRVDNTLLYAGAISVVGLIAVALVWKFTRPTAPERPTPALGPLYPVPTAKPTKPPVIHKPQIVSVRKKEE